MIAAIYCPGQSLCAHILSVPPSRYDVTWSVNTAIKIVTTTWLAASDTPLFNGLIPFHRPLRGVLTMDETANQVRDDINWAGLEWQTWSHLETLKKHNEIRQINWTTQAAICHAIELGAEEIDLFGADLCGKADATGYLGEDRSDLRWARELNDLNHTIAWARTQGANVNRIK